MDLGRLIRIGVIGSGQKTAAAPPAGSPSQSGEASAGPSPEPMRGRGWTRGHWLLLLILALTATAAWRVSQIEGLAAPIHVAGPSMSPTLWGPHRRVVCQECGFQHPVHAPAIGVHAAATRSLRCFGCGRLGIQISSTVQAGDRVLIDRAAYLLSTPARDDLIAIRMPGGGLQVKRVVGLPGELVRIDREGNLVIGEQPLRMSPEQSWKRSVVVYDDRYRGPTGSRWQKLASGDWHVYHHVDIHHPGGGAKPEKAARIRDDDPANASLSRFTHPVEDLQLALRVRSTDRCTLEVVFATAEQPIFASLELPAGEQTVRVSKIGKTIWHLPSEGPPRRAAREGGAFPSETDRPEGNWPEVNWPEVNSARPLAIRLRGRGAEGDVEPRLDRLWLGRSVRFDPPRAYADRWLRGVTVAAGRYLVIGDNPPASEDSRSAPEGISADRIMGRVIRWPL